MKLVPCTMKEIEHLGLKRANLRDTLIEFVESGLEIAEIVDYTHKDARVCQAALRSAIKKYRFFGVKASARGERVFLIKEKI